VLMKREFMRQIYALYGLTPEEKAPVQVATK
jgi:hypothetical protein